MSNISTKINKFKYELIVCVLLIIRALQYLPVKCSNYIAFQYLLSYRYGFIARGLVGSLFDRMPFMSHSLITGICLIVEIILSLTFVAFVSIGMKKCQKENKKMTFLLVCIIVMSPASPAFTYAIQNFGRFDAILIIIALIQAMVFVKCPKGYSFIIVALTIIGCMVHPVFTFLYFCVSESLLIYDLFRGNEKRIEKLIMLILNTVAIIAMFSVFHFHSFVSEQYTFETMFQSLQSRTDVDITVEGQYVHDWYFNSAEGLLRNTVRPSMILCFMLLCTLLFMLPYIYGIGSIWKVGIQNKEENKVMRFVYLIMSLSWLTTLPCFFLEIDYGRWTAAAFLTQFILLLTLVFTGDKNILNGIEQLKSKILKKPVVSVAIILMAVSLGVFRDIVSLDISNNIYQLLIGFMR